MTSRLEKLTASLKREQHKQDIKRLKKAKDYLDMGFKTLEESFNDPHITNSVADLLEAVREYMPYYEKFIEEG